MIIGLIAAGAGLIASMQVLAGVILMLSTLGAAGAGAAASIILGTILGTTLGTIHGIIHVS
jgi:hypothetical protein